MPPRITSTPLQAARCFNAYRYSDAADGPAASPTTGVSWRAAKAPPGFAIDARTGAISWTPSGRHVGPHRISLIAENAAGADTQDFDVEVSCPTVALETTTCGCGAGGSDLGLAALYGLYAFLSSQRRRRDSA